ncbi:hypothetical protein [Rhodoferax bucti]|uniref:hypothetical protein n=1 Tax=Rhodoferax bucti TaxID=2576305 RepID=UPI0011081300|nr:hypothetical protein [Rhodoferax bucti]
MYDLLKLLHLIAAIVWMGGMTFMLIALRPAALAVMEAQPRAVLMAAVWQRFFVAVLIAIVVLLATGGYMFGGTMKAAREATGHGVVPLGWTVMTALGGLMFLIFGHIYFAGFAKFRRAVAAAQWPVAAKAAGQIHMLVVTNFALGWAAIAAVKLLN